MTPQDILYLALISGCTSVLLTPVFIVRMVLKHRERLAEIQNKKAGGSPAMVEEVAQLRREMEALRETTTRFDMSFDAALSRVENRMHAVEQATATTGPAETNYTTAPSYGEHETVSLRR